MKRIRREAERELARRGRYAVMVKIGICQWSFTVKDYGIHGSDLRKGDEIIGDFDRVDRALTALYDQIGMYV